MQLMLTDITLAAGILCKLFDKSFKSGTEMSVPYHLEERQSISGVCYFAMKTTSRLSVDKLIPHFNIIFNLMSKIFEQQVCITPHGNWA